MGETVSRIVLVLESRGKIEDENEDENEDDEPVGISLLTRISSTLLLLRQ